MSVEQDGAVGGPLNGVSTRTTPAPPPPMALKLEETERLRMENLFLKTVNQRLQLKNLELEKLHVVSSLQEIEAELEKLRQELSRKYGVAINRESLLPDGTIRMPVAP